VCNSVQNEVPHSQFTRFEGASFFVYALSNICEHLFLTVFVYNDFIADCLAESLFWYAMKYCNYYYVLTHFEIKYK